MLLSSCEKQTIDSGNVGFTVGVDTYRLPLTKAAPAGDPDEDEAIALRQFTSKFGEKGFKVSAFNGTAARMENVTVKLGNLWLPEGNFNWYSGETLDFYAMAAGEATDGKGVSNLAVNAAQKKMTFNYILPDFIPENQEEVMAGWYSGTGTTSNDNGPARQIAPLTFHHALSAIRIKAGDIAESGILAKSIILSGIYHKGSCTVDMANLGTDDAIVWTIDTEYRPALTGAPADSNTNIVKVDFTPSVAMEQDIMIGGDQKNTFMVIPQTLTSAGTIQVVLEDASNNTYVFKASLEGINLKPGKIYDITVNFKGITLDTFDEQPISMIVPWVETATIEYNDFALVPKTAYLTSGPAFNAVMKSFVTDPMDLWEIVFDRGGQVDEDGVEIQDPAHPEGYPIYAKYYPSTHIVRISTHANEIKTHQDCSEMFKDLFMENIQWGMFFDTTETTDMNSMFMNCEYVKRLNFINVLNTVNVTDFSHMFDGCLRVRNIYLGNDFDTKKATDLSYMFNDCGRLENIDLGSKFDTRNVTDMSYMFCNCATFTTMEVGERFYTYKVRDFSHMFENIRVQWFHFNSRFAIKSQYNYLEDHDVPLATDMLKNSMNQSGRRAVFVSRNTWNWVNNASRTGINWTPDGYGTTGLEQIVLPRED